MFKRTIFLCSLFFLIAAEMSLQAALPYIIGKNGEYAVIDSSKSVVISTGNILVELLANATFSTELKFLANHGDVGSTYLDPLYDRVFLFTGEKPGAGGDGSTDGVLVARMSNRSFMGYIKAHKSAFGYDDIFVSDDNQIFFPGGKGMVVYDGKSYKEAHDDITWPYMAAQTCFIPGERQISDRMFGIYYLDKYVKSKLDGALINDFKSSQFQKIEEETAHLFECRNGKALLAERVEKIDETNPPKLIVYDLKNDKEQLRFSSEYLTSPGDWLLSRDGQYAVWIGMLMLPDATDSSKLLHDGHFAVYRMDTGEKVSDVKLPEKRKEELSEYEDYNFKDFSVDGRSIVFYSEPYLYVVDMKTGRVTSRVELPFTPGWYNSTGFVVWQ